MIADSRQAGQTETWPYYTAPEMVDVHGLATAYRRACFGPVVVYLHGLWLTGKWLPFHREPARRDDRRPAHGARAGVA